MCVYSTVLEWTFLNFTNFLNGEWLPYLPLLYHIITMFSGVQYSSTGILPNGKLFFDRQ